MKLRAYLFIEIFTLQLTVNVVVDEDNKYKEIKLKENKL